MGRKIFEEEEDRQRFPRQSDSVWINKDIRGSKGADPRLQHGSRSLGKVSDDRLQQEPRVLTRHNDTVAKHPISDDSPLWMGSSTNPFLMTELRGQQSRSPFRVPIIRAPKLVIGWQKRSGKVIARSGGSPVMSGRRLHSLREPQGRKSTQLEQPFINSHARTERVIDGPISVDQGEGTDVVRRR
ncbi:unnamed protein product [Linum trigynum]|uniref:Uncharacterized protein n=1 Tax=Linum trigynum TaxID=586398 RepID=A0AAV2CE14_9ROSI